MRKVLTLSSVLKKEYEITGRLNQPVLCREVRNQLDIQEYGRTLQQMGIKLKKIIISASSLKIEIEV